MGNRFDMGFQGKMSRFQEDNARIRNIAPECFCARRNKEEIVYSPDGEQLWTLCAEKGLV